MANIINDFFDCILPPRCIICGRAVNLKISPTIPVKRRAPVCNSCLCQIVPLKERERWFLCLADPMESDKYPGLTLYSPYLYDSFFSRAVPLIKFQGEVELASFLGDVLGALLKLSGIEADMVIPVPLSRERFEERGFNQAEILAREVAGSLELPVVTDALIRTKYTDRQTEMKTKEDRCQNVWGAFGVDQDWDVSGARIILVDDVVTTGFTLHEAASVLLDNGATSVLCVALCGNRGAFATETY